MVSGCVDAIHQIQRCDDCQHNEETVHRRSSQGSYQEHACTMHGVIVLMLQAAASSECGRQVCLMVLSFSPSISCTEALSLEGDKWHAPEFGRHLQRWCSCRQWAQSGP